MINAFQMSPAASGTGLKLSANANTTTGNAGDSLFSILLNNLSVSSETENNSLGASLFTGNALADMIAAGNNASSLTDTVNSINKTGKKSEQGSLQASDLLLPQSAMPNLISFLEKKGFSSEQIDGILLSARNDEGLIQINKLVTAMQSAKAGRLSEQSGLVIQAASVPKVQELLFKMGLGVGEVKETIDQASDQKGGLSLDKLAETLKEQTQGTISKSELVSMLDQNNISVTSQATGIATVAADGINNINFSSQVSNIHEGASDLKNPVAQYAKISDVATTASDPHSNINDDAQVYDINKAATELKKEFMNFVNGSSQGSMETEEQKTAVSFREKVGQAQEIKSLKKTLGTDSTGSNLSKAVTQESTQDAGPLNQTLSKGQTQWQKGDQAKIIDILNGEKSINAKAAEKEIFQEQVEKIQEPADFLRQGDQKVKQEILTDINENKTISQTQTTEAVDIKESLLNIKETQTIDLTSQNMNKVSGDAEIKGHTKSVYNLPEPLPKVFDRMVVMIKNGEQTGKIMIQPPELGKIDIDLTIKNGHVQASLSTENYAVKEIIETNLNQLKQQLNDQGLIVEQFNVSVGSQNRQFGEENGPGWGNGNGSSQSGVSAIEDVTAATDEGTSSGIINGKNRIDVRV